MRDEECDQLACATTSDACSRKLSKMTLTTSLSSVLSRLFSAKPRNTQLWNDLECSTTVSYETDIR